MVRQIQQRKHFKTCKGKGIERGQSTWQQSIFLALIFPCGGMNKGIQCEAGGEQKQGGEQLQLQFNRGQNRGPWYILRS